MKFRYVIYQIPDAETPRDYFFGEGIETPERYRSVWAGEITCKNGTEAIKWVWQTFNMHHPIGYRARSLSCGDVVGLQTPNDIMRFHYCQRVGWGDVTEEFARGEG